MPGRDFFFFTFSILILLTGRARSDRVAHPAHSYRGWLGDNGEPLTVQKELMRHASIQTTLNTDSGGMMESMRQAHGRVVKQAIAS